MNKSTIKKLFSKGNISGDELGKLIIQNSIEEQLTFMRTGKQGSLFEEDELRIAERSLSDYDRQVYSCYIGLYSLLHSYFNLLQGQYQQFLHAFYRLLLGLVSISFQVETTLAKENMPLIMTQALYDKKKKEADAEGKAYKESYIGLFIELLSQYTEKLEGDGGTKTPITEIYKAYISEPAKNKKLIELYRDYNKDFYKEGNKPIEKVYYTLTDGRPANTVKMPEFIDDFLSRPLFKKLEDRDRIKSRYLRARGVVENLKSYSPDNAFCGAFSFEGDTEREEVIKEYEECFIGDATPYRVSQFIDGTRQYFIATDREELADKLDELEDEILIINDIPTKADFLLYWGFINLPYTEDAENAKVFDLYLKELPELAEVINKELLSTKGLEALKDITPKDYAKELIEWKDLVKSNVFTYKERLNNIFYMDYRQGVAILDDNSISEDQKKKDFEEGFYKPQKPNLNKKMAELLEAFNKKDALLTDDDILIQNKLLIPSLQFIYGVNAFFEDLEDIYRLKGLKEAFGTTTADIEKKMTVLNFYIGLAEDQIINSLGYDTKESIITRELLNCNYKIIPLAECKTPEEQRKQARTYIADIKNFKNNGTSTRFYKMYLPENANGPVLVRNPEEE